MVTVKTLSFDLVSGSSCRMGESHQRRISRPTARALCGMYPLPDIGAETVVAVGKDLNRSRLYVQNISGHFYLACPHASVPTWPEVFGVQVVETVPTFEAGQRLYWYTVERMPVLRVVDFERTMRRDKDGNDCIVSEDDGAIRWRAKLADLYTDHADAETRVKAARAAL